MTCCFPTIGQSDFNDACQALLHRCQDNLDETDWLGVKWQSGTLFIRTQYTGQPFQHAADEPANLGNDVDALDEDASTMRPAIHRPETMIVDFSITLSQTYQVPVLWFTVVQPPITTSKAIDIVYDHLVLSTRRPALQQLGVMGGISIANHPVLELPAYFIHPCNSADALQVVAAGKTLTPEQYLILWLGLIGSCVGLHVPSNVMLEAKNVD